jgi:hypothetical protein
MGLLAYHPPSYASGGTPRRRRALAKSNMRKTLDIALSMCGLGL